MSTLADRISQSVKSSGKSQRQIAIAIGITPQALNKWLKTGNADKEHLLHFARETGVDFEWLLTGREYESATGKGASSSAIKLKETITQLDESGRLPEHVSQAIELLLHSLFPRQGGDIKSIHSNLDRLLREDK